MYEFLKRHALAILKVPPGPPEEPAGTHESVVVFRASPRYLTYLLIPYVLFVLVVGTAMLAVELAATLALVHKGWTWLGVVLWAVGGVILATKALVFYVTTRLNYELRWYIVTDRSLRIREGVWLVREVTLTFANVQNINVTQGPLQRYFGISDLIVETAGGGSGASQNPQMMMLGHHGVLRGVENAAELRERIQALLRAYRAAGLGDPEERHAAPAATADAELAEVLRGMRDETKALRVAIGA